MKETFDTFHFSEFVNALPPSLLPIFITLMLSFLIGLEREEHVGIRRYNFGGIRTFPIIGLCGYLTGKLTAGQPIMSGLGIAVMGALLWLSYRKKLELSSTAGMTSEISGLFTFLLGALIYNHAIWEATTLAVIVLLLLELKTFLERLAKKIPSEEVYTFTRFLLMTAVILPIVPNRDFSSLHFNPFHTWLIVVAISGLSYGAYVVERLLGPRRGIFIAAILGGIYSSTSTTVVLAKRSIRDTSNHLYSGAIIVASGFMYFRLVVLIAIFNWALARRLILPLIILGAIFTTVGVLWMVVVQSKTKVHHAAVKLEGKNPLELQTALFFAVLFSAMMILTNLALKYFGFIGIFSLAIITGLTDVDPLVMSLTQSSKLMLVHYDMAAKAIIVTAASNDVMKGAYTAIWARKDMKISVFVVLAALALLSLLMLFFL